VLADREPSFINGDSSSSKTNKNGYILNGDSSSSDGASTTSSNGKTMAETAPEVNQWTSIMTDGYLQKEPEMDVTQLYQDLKDMSDYDKDEIEKYWAMLMPKVSYLGTEHVARVYDALRVAYRAHSGQMRKSGEPFIIHPVEVALLLSGLQMDVETVMSGLLHDTVEDTDLTFDQLDTMFGSVVRSIVEGETKVSKLPKLAFSDYADEQAENLRQMFIAMTDDYRIIIVKLADRLHNMRTLRHMKPEKQIKISRETLDIFAPLAHRMGIWQFKSELEDTAFMYLYPQEYKRLNRRLRQHQTKYQETLDLSQDLLRKTLKADRTLKDQAIDVKVYGRTKEIYSLWYKMENKAEHNLDHIVDVVALRVIITPKESEEEEDDDPPADRGVWLCYHVLGLAQHLPGFQPVPTRVKDYISFPKPNGYQSLHTALMLNGQTIEVQIRTNDMHQVAEYGMASHWAYIDEKRRKGRVNGGGHEDLFNTPWLSSIKEWQNDMINSRDFVDSVRSELLGKRVFVFLRNGKILNLARGATAIDAAFQIHTEIGLNMHGVEINGKPVPFSYVLKNGDVVSIQTGEGKPQTDWMRHAKSRSTRSKLRAYFRLKQKESLREAGKILVMDYLWMHGPLIEKISFLEEEFTVPTTVKKLKAFLPGKTRYKDGDVDELLVDIGKNHDRAFLHQTMSKLFLAPLSQLVDEEKNRKSLSFPSSVLAAVRDKIRDARHAAIAAAHEEDGEENRNGTMDASGATRQHSAPLHNMPQRLDTGERKPVEYADFEHLCKECMPILGDEIIGTKPEDHNQAITTVHRLSCPHAQRAINEEKAALRSPSPLDGIGRINSWSLRSKKTNTTPKDRLVSLQWTNFAPDNEVANSFLAEVAIVAQDRKLLLADCSEIVSELSEIAKTGSATTNEHATLIFLIRVSSLQHLQNVMDRLGQVRSVMSVERRFGSELL